MDASKFESYLSSRYKSQIDWYDKKSLYNQKMYKTLQFFLIAFSSLTPILIVVEKLVPEGNQSWLNWIPATIAVLVATSASLIKAFRYQENWLNYRTTCETLRKEIHYYEAGSGEYDKAEDREKLFVERVESLISRENTLWLTAHESTKKSES